MRDAKITVARSLSAGRPRARDTTDRYSRFGMEARPWRLIKRPSGRGSNVCLERAARYIRRSEPRYLFVPWRLARIALRLRNERHPIYPYARSIERRAPRARVPDVRRAIAGLDARRTKFATRAGVQDSAEKVPKSTLANSPWLRLYER